MTILTTFHSFWIFNFTLQVIVTYQLYLPILFIALTLSEIITLVPIRHGLRELFRKDSKKIAIFFVLLVILLLYADAIYFLIDPILRISVLDPSTIQNKETLDDSKTIIVLASFLVLPLLYTITVNRIKNELKNKNYPIDGRLRDNRKFTCEIILYNSIGFAVVFGFFIFLN